MSSTARFDELKKKFDENPRRYFAPLANEFRKSGDAEQAVMICEEFLPQQPGHMSGHIVYGQALFDLGRLDDARTVFETALTLDPENLIALRHLGDIAQSHGDLESARHWYQRVLEADPRNEEVQALITSLDAGAQAAPPPIEAAPAPTVIEQSMMVEFAPDFGTSDAASASEQAAPPPLPPSPQPGQLLELDVVAEHALGAAPAAVEPAPPPPSAQSESAEPPFDSISLEGLEPSVPAREAGDSGHAHGFEPMEFSAPTSDAGAGLVDKLEHGEFSAPPSTVAPLDGLEETAIGAFEARPAPSPAPDSSAVSGADTPWASSGPPPLPDLEPLADPDTSAASDQPPVDIPPEVIAAEAELMDARDAAAGLDATQSSGAAQTFAGAEAAASPPGPPPRVTPSQPFVTETMAELYVKQGFREQALDVYKLLLAASPENPRLRDRVAELQQRDEVDSGPNVRDFFARLAARRPNDPGAAAVPPASDDFASFDSFETVPETTPASSPAPTPAPTPEPQSSSPASGEGSLDALFGQRAVGQADASAASALAQAFGSGSEEPLPISGRPARAAAGELSLDSVFKDGGARPPRSAQSFSFDQFFSESAAADAPTEPGPASTPAQGTGAQAQPAERSADDIEQFNSWLQGLKQR